MRNPINGQFMSTKLLGVDLMGGNTDTIEIAAILVLAGYVFAGGFWNGFYGHILLATGYDVSSNVTIMLTVLNTTCNTLNSIPNSPQSANLCYASYNAIQSSVSLSDFFATLLPIASFIFAVVILSAALDPDSPAVAIIGLIVAIILSVVLNFVGYAVGFGLLGGYATIPAYATSVSTTTTLRTTVITNSTTTIAYSGNCTAFAGFFCTKATLSQENKLSILLEQFIEPTIYNVWVGCGDAFSPNGMPIATFYQEPFNLTYGQFQQIVNLSCSGASNGTFDGYVWINYTKHPGVLDRFNNSDFQVNATSIKIPR